jgi:hypothetical protein
VRLSLCDFGDVFAPFCSAQFVLLEYVKSGQQLRQHLPGCAEMAPVTVNVYDLTPQNSVMYWLGCGVYHTGVEVHGIEYAFGGGAALCWSGCLLSQRW